MSQYNEIIADIETLGVRQSTVVLSIGLVKFNLDDTDSYDTIHNADRCFYGTLDAESQIKRGRTVDFSTLQFWSKQDIVSRTAAFLGAQNDVAVSLRNMASWIGNGEYRMWGNGNTFDNVILRHLFDMYEIPFPIAFWNDMDLRTLKYLSNSNTPQIDRGTIHHALDDAKYEVLCAQHYWKQLSASQA